MKKIIIFILINLYMINVSYSEIYKCEFSKFHTVVIKTENWDGQTLASIDAGTGKFTEKSSIYALGVRTGELIEFKNNKSNDHNLIVLYDPDKKSDWSFRAVYFDGTLGHPYVVSVRIDYWDEKHPIYMYDDFTKKILKGTCQ